MPWPGGFREAAQQWRERQHSVRALNRLAGLLNRFDRNGDGAVDLDEFCTWCLNHGAGTRQLRMLFDLLDQDRDSRVTPLDDINGYGRIDHSDGRALLEVQRRREPYAYPVAIHPKLRRAFQRHTAFLQSRLTSIVASEQPLKNGLRLYHFEVPVLDLPPQLEGISIAHISDLHFQNGHRRNLEDFLIVRDALPQTDFVILTGDTLNAGCAGLDGEAARALAEVPYRLARLAVLGNHDLSRESRFAAGLALQDAGFAVLRNSGLQITVDGAPLSFYWTDDALKGSVRLPDISHESKHHTRILLTHNLDALNNSAFRGIDLVLSGHIHAGEFDLGIFNGAGLLKMLGAFEDLNGQICGWKALSQLTLSYVSPGLASKLGFRLNVAAAGATVMRLVRQPEADTRA